MTETATNLNIDSVHLAWRCGTEDQTRRVVSDLEGALGDAKTRRDKILADISKANNGDKRQIFVLGGLNKQEAETGRLILSIEAQLREAKKRLATLQTHAAGAAARKASEDSDGGDRLFLVKTPNGGQIRHRAVSIEALRSKLLPGYTIHGEIFGANDAGAGGVVSDINPSGPSIMEGMLLAHGDDLLKFLEKHGIVGSDKTVVIIPSNGRDEAIQ
jgi:hypothetical protein